MSQEDWQKIESFLKSVQVMSSHVKNKREEFFFRNSQKITPSFKNDLLKKFSSFEFQAPIEILKTDKNLTNDKYSLKHIFKNLDSEYSISQDEINTFKKFKNQNLNEKIIINILKKQRQNERNVEKLVQKSDLEIVARFLSQLSITEKKSIFKKNYVIKMLLQKISSTSFIEKILKELEPNLLKFLKVRNNDYIKVIKVDLNLHFSDEKL